MTTVLDWLKVLGPLLVAVAVLIATWWFQRWQVRLARQKLRHDLFDRRFAIYLAFRDFLLALLEKDNHEVKARFRQMDIALAQAQFLLDDPQAEVYLRRLYDEATKKIISIIMFLENMGSSMGDPQIAQDIIDKDSQLGQNRLNFVECHLGELPKRLKPSLKLTDFT